MATEPMIPFWFRLRQGKADPVGPETYRLTAPNLAEAFITIRPQNGHWLAALKQTGDGPVLAEGNTPLSDPRDAWEAAFELYRITFVI